MLASAELAALLAILVLLGGGHAVGAFDPILGALSRGAELLRSYFNSDSGSAPISVNHRNVERSDTKIEVHNHFYGTETPEQPALSDGGPKEDDSEES